jgi:hypothetical protein
MSATEFALAAVEPGHADKPCAPKAHDDVQRLEEVPQSIEITLQMLSGNVHVVQCLPEDGVYNTVSRELFDRGVVFGPSVGYVFEHRNGNLKVVSCNFYRAAIHISCGDTSIGGGAPTGDGTTFGQHGVESGAILSVAVDSTPYTLDCFWGSVKYNDETVNYHGEREHHIMFGKWRCPGRPHWVKLSTIGPRNLCSACVDAAYGV